MGDVILGDGVSIHPSARINVTERLVIGAHSTIHENVTIEGRNVVIGQEAWLLPGAIIGGGSCFERQSSLKAGHFLHMGRDSFINTARPVVLGDEVGLGTRTAIFTHGAYLSALDGFPVSFAPVSVGSRVWLPGATVNPGVTIGDDVVVGVGSVVTRDIPTGSLAAGAPAKVIHEQSYPRPLMGEALQQFWVGFLRDYDEMGEDSDSVGTMGAKLIVNDTVFDTEAQQITGEATRETERLRDQLRRYGIRFYCRPVDGYYQSWR